MEKVASLQELDGPRAIYSLNDAYKLNSILDMKLDLEQESFKKRSRK